MLKYLTVVLADDAAGYCHYANRRGGAALMPADTLRRAIVFGMKANLAFHFVYPVRELPETHTALIDSIDHTDIRPYGFPATRREGEVGAAATVWVVEGLEALAQATLEADAAYVVRTTRAELCEHTDTLAEAVRRAGRLNVVIRDVEHFDDTHLPAYAEALARVARAVETARLAGGSPQLNLLTDRLALTRMNNCGAGAESVAVCPDGGLYACPAFYFDPTDGDTPLGTLLTGLDIKNAPLYRLDHAPLCRKCDAWHCKRCVWLNRRLTLEVNTPSHQQCVVAHTEREASRKLLLALQQGGQLEGVEMKPLDYNDPFDKVKHE